MAIRFDKVKYFPEIIPDTYFLNLTAGENTVIDVDEREFEPSIIKTKGIISPRNPALELRLITEEYRIASSLVSLRDYPAINEFNIFAKRFLNISLYATAGVSNYPFIPILVIDKPSIALKLKLDLPLTDEERAISEKHNIAELVEKGNLPLPYDFIIEREYQILGTWEKGRIVKDIKTAYSLLETVVPTKPNRFLVLVGISAERPADVGYGIKIGINRDNDKDYLELDANALDLNFDLPCFIPALNNLEIKIKANISLTGINYKLRYKIWECKMTNILKARWIWKEKALAPTNLFELWEKVRGGVL